MRFERVRAVLFDKDGTLFDFEASWSAWAIVMIDRLAEGDAGRKAELARVMGFDLVRGGFTPDSHVIAHTLAETAELIAPCLARAPAEIVDILSGASAQARMVPVLPLAPLLDALRVAGHVLGVATNADEREARRHLEEAGIIGQFAHVLGYDSGYTPKPAPDMLLGFAARSGVAPGEVVMVGDSTHDLVAGRAAGMLTVGVLTGLAPADVLAPHADVVLPDIGHLPELLGLTV